MTGETTSRSISTLKHPHTWVVAAEFVVDDSVARIADFRGSFRTKTEQRIDALDTYCRACRRAYSDVVNSDCAAAIDDRHLIGGDQSVRAKRKLPAPPPAGAKLVPGGKFTRYGLKAYVSGVPVCCSSSVSPGLSRRCADSPSARRSPPASASG